jgi:glycosyltransferase involved in cell wall biosynthesis
MPDAKTLRVGFDATAAVKQGGGIGRYVRELLRALASIDAPVDFKLFYAAARGTKTYPLPELTHKFGRRHLPFDDIWLARAWHRLQIPLAVDWITGRIDVFHSPDFTLPPTRRGTRTLLTVHDLSFARDPDSALPVLRTYLNRVVPRSVARADHILADSLATRDDLVSLYGTPPEKISVLYSGVNDSFRPVTDTDRLLEVRAGYGLGHAPFVLAVGTLQPRKNYVRLIQAFAQLAHNELNLVIVGGRGWLYDDIFAQVKLLGLEGRVIFAGFASDADLPALYSAAAVFAYPSLYEGFGLPILEAFASGTPVITSTASCLPEVAGDAALLVSPDDVGALAHALRRVVAESDLRESLVQRGFARVRDFSWEESARKLVEIYGRLARLQSMSA